MATKHSVILLHEKLLSKYKQYRGFKEIYACKAQLWNSLTVQRSFCLSKNRTFSEGGSDTLFLKILGCSVKKKILSIGAIMNNDRDLQF